MPPTITATDQNFWLAYCDAICTVAGFDPKSMPDGAIFFGANAQCGPPAGNNVDQDYTNTGLYAIADNLLSPNNLFFLPSASNSYIKSLLTYLGYVDLQGNPSAGQLSALATAYQNMTMAQTSLNTQRAAAYSIYKQQVELQMISPNVTFPIWLVTNAPAYNAALAQNNAASGAYQQQVNTVYGAQSTQYTADFTRINTAMYPSINTPGLTMEACQSSPASAMAVLQAVQQGQPVPDPVGKYLVPYYGSANYATIVSNFMGAINNTQIPTQSVEVNLNSGKTRSASDFGTSTVSGSSGVTWFPWLSVSASATATETSSTIISEADASNIQVEMTYKYIQTADIAPGIWNIGDPKNTYKLKPGAPDTVRTLVRPSRLVLGCAVGWKITVTDSVKSTIDTQMQTTRAAGGRLNIFGISCSIGSSSSSTDNTTHSASWDSSGKTLVITPSFDSGYASVLAVIGEKIQTV